MPATVLPASSPIQPNPSLDTQVREAAAAFRETFGREPVVAAVAPGRVNLIGEHTDYNDGFVLPMAIERRTVAMIAPELDSEKRHTARIASTGVEGMATFGVTRDLERGKPAWANYVRGVAAGFIERDLPILGFDLLLHSSVPAGGGLSSSAALEVATATALASLFDAPLEGVIKAELCQRAEHQFAGVPCGIMDQFISALGQDGHALLIDCLSHDTTPVPLSDPAVTILIANTNVAHELAGGKYQQRRGQCEYVAREMSVQSLRYVNMESLDRYRASLGETEYKRARHVISENARTLEAAEALQAREWERMGRLMLDSHASLRDDYEVSCEELDAMVEVATGLDGVYGSRMTGGGFGGCTVSLVRSDAVEHVASALAAGYHRVTGLAATLYASRAEGGAREVEISPRR